MYPPPFDFSEQGLSVQVSFPSHRIVRLIAARDGSPAWTTNLVVTDGDPWLRGRATMPILFGGVLLIETDASHDRGSSTHMERLHAVGPDGEVVWMKDVRLVARPVPFGTNDVLLLVGLDNRYVTLSRPPVEARQVNLQTGEVKRRWSIDGTGLPDAAWAEPAWRVKGAVSSDGDSTTVTLSWGYKADGIWNAVELQKTLDRSG